MKKKTLLISMILMMLMVFTACGKSTPTEVVENQLKQIKTEDYSLKISRVFSDTKLQEQYKDDFNKFNKKLQDFDYEVEDEKIDGDKATVVVKIKTYDFGKVYKSTADQILNDFQRGKVKATDDIAKYAYDLVFKNLNSLKEKTYKKKVTVNCTKNDKGEWETDIDSSNVQMQDALMGGMITAAGNISTGQQ